MTRKSLSYTRWLEKQAKRRAKARSMRTAGATLAEIGRALKISHQRVSQLLKASGP